MADRRWRQNSKGHLMCVQTIPATSTSPILATIEFEKLIQTVASPPWPVPERRAIAVTAETPASARLIHPDRVRGMLVDGVARALARLDDRGFEPLDVGEPVRIRMRFASTTHVDILQSIPGLSKLDGFTVAYTATDADQAYRLIRLMYRFIQQ